ncbi:MAG: thiamine phosphate synthase [Proteobacteria bacterium]|nr:thiamine phosphate synthase [Pseudomonadota bacterium]
MASVLARRKLARLAACLNAKNGYAGKLPFLVLMSDDERLADPYRSARALPRGCMVIVRARDAARRADIATTLLHHARDLIVLIADDPELALAVRADGVHLPQARAREASHWRARHPGWLITASAHSFAGLRLASAADAVFLSPAFPTRSHPDHPSLGATRLMLMASQARVPVYALGGIGAANAGRLAGSRLAGLAAIDGLSLANLA